MVISIFISSKKEELQKERTRLKELEEYFANKIKVFTFEHDVGSNTQTSEENYLNKVRECQIYLGLFKNEYSHPTYKEYLTAEENQKEILVYLDNSSIEKRDSQLIDFIEKIKTRHVYDEYETLEELFIKVRDKILDLISEQFFDQHRIELDDFETVSLNLIENQVENVEDWKRGSPLNFKGIRKNYDFRRESLLESYIHDLDFNNILILIGKTGFSKTTILRELTIKFLDNGYDCLNLDGSNIRILSINKNICNLKMALENKRKILLAIDNMNENIHEIFYLIHKINEFGYKENIKFIITISPENLDKLYPDYLEHNSNTNIYYRNESPKILIKKSLVRTIPRLSNNEIIQILTKYNSFPNKDEILLLAGNILKETDGYPILVFQYIFQKTQYNIQNIISRYLYDDDQKFLATIVFSLLRLSNVKITDEMIINMRLQDYANSLLHVILIKNDNNTWTTFHQKWDEDFLSVALEKPNYNDPANILDIIFRLEESIIFRCLVTLYNIYYKKNILDKRMESIVSKLANLKSIRKRSNFLTYIGDKFTFSKKYSESYQYLSQAIELDPDNALVNEAMARLRYVQKQFDECIPYYFKAVNLRPDLTYNFLNLLNALYRSGKHYDKIEDFFNKALTICDGQPDLLAGLYNTRGISFFPSLNFQEAEKYLLKSLSTKRNSIALMNLGKMAFYKHDYKKALSYFEEADEISPHDPYILEFKINTLKMLEKDTKKDFKKLQKLDPEFFLKFKRFYQQPTNIWKTFLYNNEWWNSIDGNITLTRNDEF